MFCYCGIYGIFLTKLKSSCILKIMYCIINSVSYQPIVGIVFSRLYYYSFYVSFILTVWFPYRPNLTRNFHKEPIVGNGSKRPKFESSTVTTKDRTLLQIAGIEKGLGSIWMHALVGAIYCLDVIYACSVEPNYCTPVYALTRAINISILITIQLYRYIMLCLLCILCNCKALIFGIRLYYDDYTVNSLRKNSLTLADSYNSFVFTAHRSKTFRNLFTFYWINSQ